MYIALERVKFHLITDHTEGRISHRFEKTLEQELEPYECVCNECKNKKTQMN